MKNDKLVFVVKKNIKCIGNKKEREKDERLRVSVSFMVGSSDF